MHHDRLRSWRAAVRDLARALRTVSGRSGPGHRPLGWVPRTDTLPVAWPILSVLQQTLATAPARHRRGLTAAAAKLSVVVAMLALTTGRGHLAGRWWRSGRRAADESGDADTAVLVRSWEVVHGPCQGRPLSEVIDLSDQAAALAGDRASAAVAGLYAGRAQALALAGRADEAGQALRRVEATTERLPAAVVADHASMFGWPEERLRHTQSYVFTNTGDTARAALAQDRAVELYVEPQARLRAQVELHRARCLIADGTSRTDCATPRTPSTASHRPSTTPCCTGWRGTWSTRCPPRNSAGRGGRADQSPAGTVGVGAPIPCRSHTRCSTATPPGRSCRR